MRGHTHLTAARARKDEDVYALRQRQHGRTDAAARAGMRRPLVMRSFTCPLSGMFCQRTLQGRRTTPDAKWQQMSDRPEADPETNRRSSEHAKAG
jgi:hypothetical protein